MRDIQTYESILVAYIMKQHGGQVTYPIELGKRQGHNNEELTLTNEGKLTLSLYLAEKYLSNFESSHCIPLPPEYFRLPWSERELLARFKY